MANSTKLSPNIKDLLIEVMNAESQGILGGINNPEPIVERDESGMNQALSLMQGGYSIGGTNPGTYDEYGNPETFSHYPYPSDSYRTITRRMIESGDSAVNSLIMNNNVQQGVKKSLTGSAFYDHLAEVDKNSLIAALADKLLGRNMQPTAQDTVFTEIARGVGHPQWLEQGGRMMKAPPKP